MGSIKATVESITPEMAREYLRVNKVNRPLNMAQVDFYASEMEKGQWRLNGEAICFTHDGRMANGQHRLNAIIKYGKPVDILVVRGVDNDSFTTFDSGRNRSNADVFALSDIPNYIKTSAAVKRYILMHHGFSGIAKDGGNVSSAKSKLNTTKQDLLNEYYSSEELYIKAVRFSASCNVKLKLFKEAEISSLFVYLVKDKKHKENTVESFFKELYYSEGVTNNTVNLLREKIIQDGMSSKTMSGRYKAAILAKTWNAYISGREYKLLKWNETEGKIQFL